MSVFNTRAEYDRNDIVLYEEVARMPPFQRKTVVLVGPPGVGKRTLKERLLHDFQNEYTAAIAHTSREPRPGEINGVHYVFETRTELEAAVRRNQMIEWGEIGDVIYGIKTETVRDVIASGKTCVLDVKPSVQHSILSVYSWFSQSPCFVWTWYPAIALCCTALYHTGIVQCSTGRENISHLAIL